MRAPGAGFSADNSPVTTATAHTHAEKMEDLASLFSPGTLQEVFETLYEKQKPYRVVDIAGVSEASADSFLHSSREGAGTLRVLHPISALHWNADKDALLESICIHLSRESDAATLRRFVNGVMPTVLQADSMQVDAEELVVLGVLHDVYCDDVWCWARDAFDGELPDEIEDECALDADTYCSVVLNLLDSIF